MALPRVPSTRTPPWFIVFNPISCKTQYRTIRNEAASEKFHHLCQSISLKTEDITRKNIPKWRRVINPSIRSKLDQKLLIGATPKISARPMTAKNPRIEYKITDFFGR